MESTLLGLILDSSIIIEAERKGETVEQLLERVKKSVGEVEIAICSVTVAELVHGVYRANTVEIRQRRRAFIDELKRHVPVHPVTDETGEIIGRISGEQAAKGIKIPFDDLAIGASALEQGYGVATLNVRHFQIIPDLVVWRQ
ncbi:MAG TPA: PIN domain-containing protein [Bryobacteraceae bacterium]|jgi:predicted nucleic acid-binding protein|nr:PIN domain-containing protein [Bryobacteraceae bacterium]